MSKVTYAVRSWDFYSKIIGSLVVLFIISIAAPNIMPFNLFQFWFIKWDWEALQQIPWFLLLVGPGMAIVGAVATKKGYFENLHVVRKFKEDLTTSILAGVFEEVAHRWIFFFYAAVTFKAIINALAGISETDQWNLITSNLCLVIPTIIVLNVLGFFGYAIVSDKSIHGCTLNLIAAVFLGAAALADIVAITIVSWEWIKFGYTALWIPFNDWASGGTMHHYLYDYGFAVGAAIVSSNHDFQSGHLYQGCIGWINSWIFGMLMFWVTFNFGLPVAMILHAAYDVVIHSIVFVDSATELATIAHATSIPNSYARTPWDFRR